MTNLITFPWKPATCALLAAWLAGAVGCSTGTTTQKEDFFTSGSREADQRATQRMAKEKQLAGRTGEDDTKSGEGKVPKAEKRQTLYERLGGETGVAAIIDDFTARVMEDPRVNWQRSGIKRGGLFRSNRSVAWDPNPGNVANLKKHLAQFIAVAAGGPPVYDGKDIKQSHADMQISNPEFDAAIGDMKASLDKLQVPDKEQKELLAILESTRPEIVTER